MPQRYVVSRDNKVNDPRRIGGDPSIDRGWPHIRCGNFRQRVASGQKRTGILRARGSLGGVCTCVCVCIYVYIHTHRYLYMRQAYVYQDDLICIRRRSAAFANSDENPHLPESFGVSLAIGHASNAKATELSRQ